MNKVVIHGNIVRAEIKTAENGTRYFKATVASDRNSKGESATDYFPVVAFGDWVTPENLGDIAKGDFVKVTGAIRLSTYGDDKRLSVEVVAKKIERPVRKEQAA
ncbi:MAG TPA: single-stranded DNA-binding protein [Candidatus Baltobacteraceae bacterium]|nr:single-stranded DNA-binding protein [Candidatus Baltobacteraceae bacterium]